MKTITFYSYKGGVGRSLALANIATYLARFGQKVCLLDFDLEAPGLHYKFQNNIQKPIEQGIVDYIHHYTVYDELPDNLKDYAVEILLKSEQKGKNPKITLIPAGNIAHGEYWKKLTALDWKSMFYDEDGEGLPLFLEIKERIKKTFKPDFLLIDSRTGITEISGISTSILADVLLFLGSNNAENLDGAKHIISNINQNKQKIFGEELKIYFALTRIPRSQDYHEKSLTRQILTNVKEQICSNENYTIQNAEDIFVIHSDRDLEYKESLKINRRYKGETSIVSDYLKIISTIIPKEPIIAKIDDVLQEATQNLLTAPNEVQESIEGLALYFPHYKTYEKLAEVYIVRRLGQDKIKEVLLKWGKLTPSSYADNVSLAITYTKLFLRENIQTPVFRDYNPNLIFDSIEHFNSNPIPHSLFYFLNKKLSLLFLIKKNAHNAFYCFKKALGNFSFNNSLEEVLEILLISEIPQKDKEKFILEIKDKILSDTELCYYTYSILLMSEKDFINTHFDIINNFNLSDKPQIYNKILDVFLIKKSSSSIHTLTILITEDFPSNTDLYVKMYQIFDLNNSADAFWELIKKITFYQDILVTLQQNSIYEDDLPF